MESPIPYLLGALSDSVDETVLEEIQKHTLIVNLDTGCVHRPLLDPSPPLKPSTTALISDAISRYLAELDVVEQHETVYVEMEGIFIGPKYFLECLY